MGICFRERHQKRGRKRIIKAEKKKKQAKKSKDDKDAAAAKEYMKKAKQLRKNVLQNTHNQDSAQSEDMRTEVGFRLVEDKWGDGDWVRNQVEPWVCKDPKQWRKLANNAKARDTKVIVTLPKFNRILTMRSLESDTAILQCDGFKTRG